ncbi:MAG TPA: VWA domain-containing protein [Chloroflexia bacterium]|nr:VWA domain-containing protein [Chloroflexia bacterium]
MGLLAPFLALAALLPLGIIVALYLLRLRRPMAPVASLHLWSVLMRDREANTLWQRLKVTPLLLLQVLALLVLTIALARPWVSSPQPVGQNIILVMDVSASMGATDARERGLETRLQAAQSKARSLVDEVAQGASMTLISSDEHASIVVHSTDDKARLRSAIDGLAVRAAGTDMAEAVELAAAVAARQGNSVIWIMSDGAFPATIEQAGEVQAQVRFFPVGTNSRNQGITALSLQQDAGSLSLFVQIMHAAEVTASRRLDLAVDDAPWNARTVSIGPGLSTELIIEDVPLTARVVAAQLALPDSLPADDQAWTINRASVPANVLLVTDGNKFLELALSLLPMVTLYKVAPADYDPAAKLEGGAPVDLTVFDSSVTTTTLITLPQSSILMIAPHTSNALLEVSGVMTQPVPLLAPQFEAGNGQPASQDGRDPLLRYVDLSGLHIAEAYQLAVPQWGRVVLASEQGPLVIAGEEGGRKVAALAFDLHDSDLPVQPAFPLLVRNLVTYLLPEPAGGLPILVTPGEAVGIEAVSPQVDRVLVEDPHGKEWVYPVTAGNPRVAFGETSLLGVYYVTQYSGETIVAQEAFTANLFSRDESVITPNYAPQLPFGVNAAANSGGAGGQDSFQREIWPWIAFAGFVVLLLEWLYAQRMAFRRAATEIRTRRALRRAERA